MQEKHPTEKKPSEYPETGKQGGQGDIGKKGGDDFGKEKSGDLGKSGEKKVGE